MPSDKLETIALPERNPERLLPKMAQNQEDVAAKPYQEDHAPGLDSKSLTDDHQVNSPAPVAFNEKTVLEDTADDEEPSEDEKRTLRRVGEWLPWSAWLVAIVEFCERFAYYGVQGLFQNYVSQDYVPGSKEAGLGFGHAGATGLNTFFSFFCYLTPILGAIIADQYLGRYKTIVIFCFIYMFGLLILWVTSLPTSLAHGAGRGGFVVAIIIIGIGTGGIKSNVAPLIADQYQRKHMAIKTLPTGERVIIDPAITIQRIYMIFYWCINLGSLSLMGTTFMEADIGFWSAYLLCFCMFIVGTSILILGRKLYHVKPPQGTVIVDSFKAIGMMIKARSLDAPKPSYQAQIGSGKSVTWDDHFVEELKRALVACRIFAAYPIFWVCYQQFSTNFVAQAGQMRRYGMPNDFMQNFDPIAIILFIPILDRFIYPLMRRAKIEFRPIARITTGFVVIAIAMAYAAIVQHYIYLAPPCFMDFKNCKDKKIGNDIHVAIQTPAYVFVGIAEIFASVTGLEYAYTKAPVDMKSFVQAIYLLTNAFGSALSEAFVPLVGDPEVMWLFTGIGISAFTVAILFYIYFRKYDAAEEEMNDLGI